MRHQRHEYWRRTLVDLECYRNNWLDCKHFFNIFYLKLFNFQNYIIKNNVKTEKKIIIWSLVNTGIVQIKKKKKQMEFHLAFQMQINKSCVQTKYTITCFFFQRVKPFPSYWISRSLFASCKPMDRTWLY